MYGGVIFLRENRDDNMGSVLGVEGKVPKAGVIMVSTDDQTEMVLPFSFAICFPFMIVVAIFGPI